MRPFHNLFLSATSCLLLSGLLIAARTATFRYQEPSYHPGVSYGAAGPLLSQDGWTSLYNGKDLLGWDTYIGPPLDDSGKMTSREPVGLNKDPNHVFTIVEQGGERVIRISGEEWGAISTQKEYADYHLQLSFRWGTPLWGQKKGKKRDSGLLYHSVGPYGADYGAWMRSQEFQVEEGNVGDYWGVAGGMQDVPATKGADAEHPTGMWNTLDLYCHGDTSIHVVNGRVMMVLYHSSQAENGTTRPTQPLVKGKLQIQSEGAEVFYKQIRIRPLDVIPAGLLPG
jgi:hypothetical protein